MENTENKKELESLSDAEILAFAAEKLKDVDLFPEKREMALEFLEKCQNLEILFS